jgi:sphingomyelin phosphodiesterase 2
MSDLTIFTLNTWCPPYAQHRAERARAISREILRLAPDVVCLQEMFLSEPRQIVMSALASAYPHQRYFDSGLIGSGLLIASRLPIVYSAFERYQMGGKPEDIGHGDFYAGKGIGMIRIRYHDTEIDIYNTHTHAQYEPANDNEYAFFNLSNLWQAVHFVRRTSGSRRHILVGDLNTRPDQLGYRVMRHVLPLQDAFTTLNPDSAGYTFHASNPYVNSADQRLDYMLHSDGLTSTYCAVVSSHIPVDGALALSDHDALLGRFSVVPEAGVPLEPDESLTAASVALAMRELKLTDNQELAQLETLIGIGLFSFDTWRQIGALSGFSRPLARLGRRLVLVSALLLSLMPLLQLFLILPRRRAAITRTIDNITTPP